MASAGPGDETTPPGALPSPASGPVPGAPAPQPLPGETPAGAPAPGAMPAPAEADVGGGAPDKIDMILAIVAFLVTVGCVVVLKVL
ncbi:MAG: hypothetical protein VYD34_06720 [Verrucomicrobiota bacterium]|nr:hypothetical protein [Verrucomicrobiota bacterium]